MSDKDFNRFVNCFFRVQNILFTRIGIDELAGLHAQQKSLLRAFLANSVDAATNKTDQVKKLIYIGITLIFIAHATITDASSKAGSLEQTFKEELPKMALA